MTTQTNMQSTIETRVMANVGAIYTARKIFGPVALKLYVLALSGLALWKLVWVTRIEQNLLQVMNGGVVAVWNYATYAILHTNVVVQITLAVATIAFVMLVADLIRSAATPRQRLAY
jgi:hypothetical protein